MKYPSVPLLLVFILFMSNAAAVAQTPDQYRLGSHELQTLDSFFVELGLAPPFYSRPYSHHQYRYYLKQIETHKGGLAASSRAELSELLKKQRQQPADKPFFRPFLDLGIGLKYQSKEIPEFQEYLYYRNSLNYAPLLKLGFIAGYTNGAIHLEYDLREDFFVTWRQKDYSTLPTGDPFVQDFDYNFPTRSYIKLGNLHVDFLAGREQMKWGPGHRSSLLISDSPPYYDMLQLSYFSPRFKASFFFAALESYLTDEEFQIQKDYQDAGVVTFPKAADSQRKSLTGHRLEFRVRENLLIGISDILLIGGRIPELTDIGPLMYLHNVYGENYSNVMMGLDFSYVPWTDIRIYGELGIDDIQNPWEAGSSIPTSLGYQAGAEVLNLPVPRNPDFYFEWVRIDPWMYNRWQPYLMFTSRRKLTSFPDYTQYASYLDFPTGYFLGGDVQSFYFELAWPQGYRGSVSVSYELRQKGEIYLNPLDPESKYENYKTTSASTPTGTVLTTHILKTIGRMAITPNISLAAELSVGYERNQEHIEGDHGFYFVGVVSMEVLHATPSFSHQD